MTPNQPKKQAEQKSFVFRRADHIEAQKPALIKYIKGESNLQNLRTLKSKLFGSLDIEDEKERNKGLPEGQRITDYMRSNILRVLEGGEENVRMILDTRINQLTNVEQKRASVEERKRSGRQRPNRNKPGLDRQRQPERLFIESLDQAFKLLEEASTVARMDEILETMIKGVRVIQVVDGQVKPSNRRRITRLKALKAWIKKFDEKKAELSAAPSATQKPERKSDKVSKREAQIDLAKARADEIRKVEIELVDGSKTEVDVAIETTKKRNKRFTVIDAGESGLPEGITWGYKDQHMPANLKRSLEKTESTYEVINPIPEGEDMIDEERTAA